MDFSRQTLSGTFAYFVFIEGCAMSRRLGCWYQSIFLMYNRWKLTFWIHQKERKFFGQNIVRDPARENFCSLSLISAFSLYCFSRSFSRWFNFTHFFASITIGRPFDCDWKTSREFNGLFLLRALGGVRSVCFIDRWHDTAALMRCY